MNIALALSGARLLHYAAVLVLAGAAWFPFYTFRKGETWPPGYRRSHDRLLLLATLLSLIGGVLWLALTAATMNDDPAAAFSVDAIRSVITGTDFGKLWAIRLVLNALLLLAVPFFGGGRAFAVFATLLALSIAGTGHTQTEEGVTRLVHVIADALHLLGAAVWLGGLAGLGWMVGHDSHSPETESALVRFGSVGMFAVAALVASGLINTYLLVQIPSRLITTRYGILLDLKLAAFLGMFGLACLNHYHDVPKLDTESTRAGALHLLKRHILLEQVLAAVVILMVAILGAMDPGEPMWQSGTPAQTASQ
ncbi:MAG TPA: copper homeostasis membrane protein CopD [Caulobacteraceae bacterium]